MEMSKPTLFSLGLPSVRKGVENESRPALKLGLRQNNHRISKMIVTVLTMGRCLKRDITLLVLP